MNINDNIEKLDSYVTEDSNSNYEYFKKSLSDISEDLLTLAQEFDHSDEFHYDEIIRDLQRAMDIVDNCYVKYFKD